MRGGRSRPTGTVPRPGEEERQDTVYGHVMPTPALHAGRVCAAAGGRHLHVVDTTTIADGGVHVGSPATKMLYPPDLRAGKQL